MPRAHAWDWRPDPRGWTKNLVEDAFPDQMIVTYGEVSRLAERRGQRVATDVLKGQKKGGPFGPPESGMP